MKVTVVGSGDAFGTGGRAHTCLRIDSQGKTICVDFGASAITGWKKLGFDCDEIDAVIVSHLHGDHFGGLPFLLLDCQFALRRSKPLLLIGPPGLRARLDMAMEAFFPGSTGSRWTFEWTVEELVPGQKANILGHELETIEVVHPSGAPPTGIRFGDGMRTFAYSGDTGWTPALLKLADGADLFFIECYSGKTAIPNHIDWPRLKENLDQLKAKKIVVTHLGVTAFAAVADMARAGVDVAHDGRIYHL